MPMCGAFEALVVPLGWRFALADVTGREVPFAERDVNLYTIGGVKSFASTLARPIVATLPVDRPCYEESVFWLCCPDTLLSRVIGGWPPRAVWHR